MKRKLHELPDTEIVKSGTENKMLFSRMSCSQAEIQKWKIMFFFTVQQIERSLASVCAKSLYIAKKTS